MPPKAKFKKEEIIAAAMEIAKRDGFDALTARALAAELGSSPRPIFTVFESMEEVQAEVKAAATKLYERYEDEEMSGAQAFKGSGWGTFASPLNSRNCFSFCLCVSGTEFPIWVRFYRLSITIMRRYCSQCKRSTGSAAKRLKEYMNICGCIRTGSP